MPGRYERYKKFSHASKINGSGGYITTAILGTIAVSFLLVFALLYRHWPHSDDPNVLHSFTDREADILQQGGGNNYRTSVIFADPSLYTDRPKIDALFEKALRPLKDIIEDWHPELTKEKRPSTWVDVVPRFDWSNLTSRRAALQVRQSEHPFVLRNVPSVMLASRKWTDDYLSEHFGSHIGKVERSNSKSFMYWRQRKNAYKGPTSTSPMSWSQFLKNARKIEETNDPNEPHYYWHAHGKGADQWIADDLDLFAKDNSFFIVDRSEYTVPIACRVGTKGLCNEMHYDTHRTFAAQLVGSKRWIFLPPSECSKLYLYGPKHQSARHSPIDVNSGHFNETSYPLTVNAMAIEAVVEEGEVAYLPSNWFHHIISQEFNVQCIARSGHSLRGDDYIEACGFHAGK